MTLKKICEALGWHRIRRWKDFVKKVKFLESAAEEQTAPQSISPYFESLFGGWRPDADLVREVMESMETRSIQEVFDAILKTPIAESQFGKAWGWVPVDNSMQLTTLEKAQQIISDTPVETLKWIAERQDCDDISEIFESICRLFYGVNVRLVVSFSSGHAFIAWPLIVNETVEWRFLEPQNDGWKTDLHIGNGRGKPGDVSQALIV